MSMVLFARYKKSKLLQCLTLNDTSCTNSYIALVDMGLILRQAIPSAEERSKMDGTQYKCADYTKKCVEIVNILCNTVIRKALRMKKEN